MHSQKLKNKIYIDILLIIIIVAIFYLFIKPVWSGGGSVYIPEKSISILQKEKKDYADAVRLASSFNDRISKANFAYINALEKLPIEKMSKILPQTADPILIIPELMKIATRPESNMLLTSPKFSDDGISKTNNNKKYNILSITFSTEGSYEQLKSFLNNLESSERIYNVTALSFSSTEGEETKNAFKYGITIDTYYLK